MTQMNDEPTMIDLFAGCGGMSVGFRDVRTPEDKADARGRARTGADPGPRGFRSVMAVEFDRAAASTYAANFGEGHTRCADIATVPDGAIPTADLVIGGPPCQGFSNLGSKDVDDPRNKLWKEYLRFVRKAEPLVFVLENVERFSRSSEFQLLLGEAREGGILEGYELRHAVLLAADYGVAQRRPRTIVIGSRIGAIEHPLPTHSRLGGMEGGRELARWRTVRDRIGHLRNTEVTGTELPERWEGYFGQQIRGYFQGTDIHFGRRPTGLSLARYACIPPGGGRFDLPDDLKPRCWREKTTGTTDVMGRMRWDAPSLTIRTEFFKPEKGQYLHPQWEKDDPSRQTNRVITHLEASLLQDFPEDYKWCGSKVEIAKQIGNAVPVGLARAVAATIYPVVQEHRAKTRPGTSPVLDLVQRPASDLTGIAS